MHTITQIEEPSSLTGQKLFYRRPDLDSAIRLKIATIALIFQIHGTITSLSKRYCVSRQFIYDLRQELRLRLEGLFEERAADHGVRPKPRSLLGTILYLRLVGKCSLHAISQLLSALGLGLASTAYISQRLEELGAALGNKPAYEGQVVFLCDEIFCAHPILVTVEPQSLAILHVEKVARLDKQAWKAHWHDLEQAGIQSKGFVKDEGSAMASAQEEAYPEIPVQSDSFHAISYQLGRFKRLLEQQAYSAISKEYERWEIWQRSTRHNYAAVQEQKKEAYLESCWACQMAIDQYDLFIFLYHHLVEQLQVFDRNGRLRARVQAQEEAQITLQYMDQLQIKGLNKFINAIRNRLRENLLAFLDRAQIILEHLKSIVPTYSLPFWCLAWQMNKNQIKAKSKKRRRSVQRQYRQLTELLQADCLENELDFETLRQLIFSRLDAIVQSSALVETVNSIIRPYLEMTRGQISQAFLQLIMFFHNHRKFQRGKRKDKAPIELLTGRKLEKGPIDLILEAAAN